MYNHTFIENFLKIVDWGSMYKHWGLHKKDIKTPSKTSLKQVTMYWKENPNQRIGQVLINLGLIPNECLIWEDDAHNILLRQGNPPQDIYTWGSILNKEGKVRSTTKYKLIKDLDTDHILSILSYFKGIKKKIPALYHAMFLNELNIREISYIV